MLLFLTALGMPIAHALMSAVFLTLIIGFDIPLSMVVATIITSVDQWIWLTMPLFLMLGYTMNEAGVTDRLINLSQEIIGHIPGGLSHVNVGVSLLLSGMSGSSSADAASVGAIMIRPMKEAGYPAAYASAITSTSSIIGPLIPPSLVLIIMAVLGQLSVLRLWLGGVVPGLLLGIGLITTGYLMARRKGFPRMEQKASLKRIVKQGGLAAPALVIPVVIIGGMRLGVFSPTEAGAVGVVYLMLLGSLVYRKLNLQGIREVGLMTVRLTGPLMWIIAMALTFGVVVGRLNVGPAFAEFLQGITTNPTVFLIIVSAVILFLGCIMEGAPLTVILYPLLHPVVLVYGIDPYSFAILFSYAVLVGQCTPPVGPSMFISNAIAGCSIADYMREGWPLLMTQVLLIPLFIFFPPLITWFPNMVMGPAG